MYARSKLCGELSIKIRSTVILGAELVLLHNFRSAPYKIANHVGKTPCLRVIKIVFVVIQYESAMMYLMIPCYR